MKSRMARNSNLQRHSERIVESLDPNFLTLTEVMILRRIRCTPTSSWRSRPSSAHVYVSRPELTDGAKVYICYRWCCFLPWQRRSSSVDWLPARKPRSPSYPPKVRSLPERRPRHDEPVSK